QRAGEPDRAIADFNAALRMNPKTAENAEILITRAALHDARKERPAAIADYSSVIALKPTEIGAWVGRAYARRDEGDRIGAEADARRALQIDPSSAPAHKLLAELSIASGHAKAAAEDSEQALKSNPKDADALKFRADAALAAG